MAFHSIFLNSCSSVASVKINSRTAVVQGITFAADRREIYIPRHEAERRLNLRISHLGHRQPLRMLTDGTPLISLTELMIKGMKVMRAESGKNARVSRFIRSFEIIVGAKYAEINLTENRLRAWQGKRLVLETPINSGRCGRRTPKGSFHATPYKARMHHSTVNYNAQMPWIILVNENVLIYNFPQVSTYPASQECIRIRLNEGNTAKFFHEWINVGTPISIHD